MCVTVFQRKVFQKLLHIEERVNLLIHDKGEDIDVHRLYSLADFFEMEEKLSLNEEYKQKLVCILFCRFEMVHHFLMFDFFTTVHTTDICAYRQLRCDNAHWLFRRLVATNFFKASQGERCRYLCICVNPLMMLLLATTRISWLAPQTHICLDLLFVWAYKSYLLSSSYVSLSC